MFEDIADSTQSFKTSCNVFSRLFIYKTVTVKCDSLKLSYTKVTLSQWEIFSAFLRRWGQFYIRFCKGFFYYQINIKNVYTAFVPTLKQFSSELKNSNCWSSINFLWLRFAWIVFLFLIYFGLYSSKNKKYIYNWNLFFMIFVCSRVYKTSF